MTRIISMLAIDLAKRSFQVCAIGPEGTCVSTWNNQTCGRRTAGEAEGAFQRTSALWLSALHLLLGREGWQMNWKKLYRIYREEGLTVRKRGGRKRAIGTRAPMARRRQPVLPAGQRTLRERCHDPHIQPRLRGMR